MRLIAISDTHGYQPELPSGDVLIHAGDFSPHGTANDLVTFCNWFGAQPHPHKVVIAGNHDIFCQQWNPTKLMANHGIIYLEDSGATIAGLSFYGTPKNPPFMDWAFQEPEEELDAIYRAIPTGLDVLLTHCPPHGILDRTQENFPAGSQALLKHVERAKPRLHIFGHIHEAVGAKAGLFTMFFNVATCTRAYRPTNPAAVICLHADGSITYSYDNDVVLP